MNLMTSIVVRLTGLAATLLSLAGFVAPAAAQWSPTQPIRVIIPYAAGGTSDIIARGMSEAVSQRLGQPFLIENRGGGATQLGTTRSRKPRQMDTPSGWWGTRSRSIRACSRPCLTTP